MILKKVKDVFETNRINWQLKINNSALETLRGRHRKKYKPLEISINSHQIQNLNTLKGFKVNYNFINLSTLQIALFQWPKRLWGNQAFICTEALGRIGIIRGYLRASIKSEDGKSFIIWAKAAFAVKFWYWICIWLGFWAFFFEL